MFAQPVTIQAYFPATESRDTNFLKQRTSESVEKYWLFGTEGGSGSVGTEAHTSTIV
jgi:hypothetical protein